MIKVLINPGHGAPDPGALGSYEDEVVQEADVALDVGIMVANFLKAAGGYDVCVHQDNNLCGEAGPYAYSVVGQANANKVNYLLSIHCNSGGGTGTECLIWEYGGRSEQLARCIQAQIVENIGTINRGVKDRFVYKRSLAVLRETTMPAVIVELAFMDSMDIELLVDPQIKEAFARSIALGFTDFVSGLEA